MKKLMFMILLLSTTMYSCKVKEKSVDQKEEGKVEQSSTKMNTMELCTEGGGIINWATYTENIEFPNQTQPENYIALVTDPEVLKDYMEEACINGEEALISLPIKVQDNIECYSFKLNPSSTMSPELAKKYGNQKSFKGYWENDQRSTIRLDYNENKGLAAYINLDGIVYQIIPFQVNGDIVYIGFDKKNAGRKKLPFEK